MTSPAPQQLLLVDNNLPVLVHLFVEGAISRPRQHKGEGLKRSEPAEDAGRVKFRLVETWSVGHGVPYSSHQVEGCNSRPDIAAVRTFVWRRKLPSCRRMTLPNAASPSQRACTARPRVFSKCSPPQRSTPTCWRQGA